MDSSNKITFKSIRIFFLAFILCMVGFDAWLTKLRATDWDMPLWVVIYPINGDGSQVTSRYINSLKKSHFEPIENFLSEEAAHFNLPLKDPISIELATEIDVVPPKPPMGGNMLQIIWWSLKLRYWVYSVDNYNDLTDIKLFLVFYDPEQYKMLEHSFGLEKGMVGVANVFADWRQAAINNVIITHELLHTIGATDKYDLTTEQPLYPDGFAKPNLKSIYPQQLAEIMGGKIPLSETESEIPASLVKVVIGPKTAKELKWKNSL